MRHTESRIQRQCVWWFRHAHSPLSPLLFAVPNGGARSAVTGRVLKEEGVVPGVADLLLLVPNSHHHGLCVEMKTPTGRASQSQREWAAAVESKGYRYEVCRSLEEFVRLVDGYLAG